MTLRIECVLQCDNHLGEGPVWDVEEGCLYWVDGTGRRVGKPSIWRLDPRTGKTQNWSLDRDVGAMALRRAGGIGAGARRWLLLLRSAARKARADPARRRRAAAHAAERRQVRPARPVLRRRHGRQRGAGDLRAVAAGSRPARDASRHGHHLLERPVLESGRSHVLLRRHLPGRDVGLRLRRRRPACRRIGGCSLRLPATPVWRTVRRWTKKDASGTRS